MAEDALVLLPPMANVLLLLLLIASGNAPRMALCGLHAGAALLEGAGGALGGGGAVGAALSVFTIRHRHPPRCSKWAERSGYHLTTG